MNTTALRSLLPTWRATKQEIEELSAVMADFGVSFSDVADNSPKQERTLEACASAIRFAAENTQLLDELLRSKKLPWRSLFSAPERSVKLWSAIEKYILAMLLIQTNGYEIIRSHLGQVLKRKGGVSA